MTIARSFALIFGAVYTLIGVLGFIRPLTSAAGDGLLLTGTTELLVIFAVNCFHNFAHLAIGLLGLAAARQVLAARRYARVIGVFYAALFVLGLFTSNLLGLLPLNGPDNLLHLASAAVALVIGFTDLGLQRTGARRASAV